MPWDAADKFEGVQMGTSLHGLLNYTSYVQWNSTQREPCQPCHRDSLDFALEGLNGAGGIGARIRSSNQGRESQLSVETICGCKESLHLPPQSIDQAVNSVVPR